MTCLRTESPPRLADTAEVEILEQLLFMRHVIYFCTQCMPQKQTVVKEYKELHPFTPFTHSPAGYFMLRFSGGYVSVTSLAGSL